MTWKLDIRNIAGIRRGSTSLEPGVNAVRGSNWQGKSSLLAAVKTAMGTESTLTEGADEGHVRLETDDGTITVELRRDGDDVVRDGEPMLSDEYDAARADLYAFLDETNEIRRAVRDGNNLEELLTRPLGFENIDERIAEYKHEREQVEAELDRATEAARKLPGVEADIAELEGELDDLRSERDEIETGSTESSELAEKRETLSDARAEREQVENLVEQLERTIEHTREKLEEHHEELENLDIPDDDGIEEQLAEAHDSFKEIQRDAEALQSVYAANKRLLEEERLHLLAEVERGLLDDTITCWTCGSEAGREEFAEQLDALGETVMEFRSEAEQRRERTQELEARRDEIRRKQRHKSDLENEITSLETTLMDREESLTSARSRLQELEARIADLEGGIEDIDERLTDVESEIKYTEARLEDAYDRREDLESKASQREMLANEHEELTEEIRWLRNRKDEIRARTREAFEEAMDDILERFDTGFETARLTPQFDLVVAREGRRASLDALSEGERELLGIVAALAGHEAFEVTESVPVLLLDNLGGLADENLHKLIQYVERRAEYLVFTAYPEHETFDGHEIDPADWNVVSRGREADVTA